MTTIDVTIQPPIVIEAVLATAQGPSGPPGSGVATPGNDFSFGDANPAFLSLVEAGEKILEVGVSIEVAFNGLGALISVGTLLDPDLLVPAGLIDPAVVAFYQVAPQEEFLADTSVYLFITPGSGASTGNGTVIFQRQ